MGSSLYFENSIPDISVALGLYSYFIATFFLAYIFHYFILKKKYILPPGPFALPIIGNRKECIGKGVYKLWAGDLRRRFGDVVLIYVGRQPTVIINDYDIAVEAFVVDKFARQLSGRPKFVSIAALNEGGQDITNSSYGPRWKKQRQLAHTVMRKFMQGNNMVIANLKSFDKLSECLPTDCAIEPSEYLHLLSFNITSALLLNKVYGIEDEEFIRIRDTMIHLSHTLSQVLYVEMLPILWYLPFPMVKKSKQLIADYIKFLDSNIKEHQENLSTDPRDITEWLLYEYQQDKEWSKTLNEVHLRQIISDILFDGSDSTQYTMQWTIGILACKPDIQGKVFKEIEDFKKTQPLGEKTPSLEWRQSLPYTCATVLEVLRFSSVSPRSVQHRAMSDCKISQFDIPKDYEVFLNIYGFHFDPKYWNHPEMFDPQRFLNANGECITKHRGFAPFSLGVRRCAGEELGRAEIFLQTFLLCSEYEFVWDERNEDKFIREADDNTFHRSPNQFKIIFKKR